MTETLGAWLWRPAVEPAWIAAVGIALATLVVMAWWRAGRGGGGRLGAQLLTLAVGVVVLLGPSRRDAATPPAPSDNDRPAMTVLLDTSASMSVEDMPATGASRTSRHAFAVQRWLRGEAFAAVSDAYDMSVLAFDDDVREIDTDAPQPPVGRSTRLFEAIRSVALRGDASATQRILVLSDGRASPRGGGREPLRIEAALERESGQGGPAVRVDVVPLGGPWRAQDVAVEAWAEPAVGFVGEPAVIRARVMRANPMAGEARVTLSEPGRGGAALASPRAAEVELDASGIGETSWTVPREAVAVSRFAVEATAPGPDALAENNRAEVLIETVDRPLRVAVLEGEPHFATSFVAQALSGDPRFAVTRWVAVAPGRVQRVDKVQRRTSLPSANIATTQDPPATLERLAAFDVVVLGRQVDRLWPSGASAVLRQWVRERGGCLVLPRGRPWGGDTAAWPQTWHADGASGPPGAVVIEAEHGGAAGDAALWIQRQGDGRILHTAPNALWRWRLTSPLAHDRFWRDAVRRAIEGEAFRPAAPLRLRLSHRRVPVGRSLEVDLWVEVPAAPDAGAPTLTAHGPAGETVRLGVTDRGGGRYAASYLPRAAGEHTITASWNDHRVDTPLLAYAVDLEITQTAADPRTLRRLAEVSGGHWCHPRQPEAWARRVLDEAEAATRIGDAGTHERASSTYAWDRPWLLVVWIALLALTWAWPGRGASP